MSSVRRRPRRGYHGRVSTLPQQRQLSILEGGLAMVDDTVGAGGEMRRRFLVAGDRPRGRDLGCELLPLSISEVIE